LKQQEGRQQETEGDGVKRQTADPRRLKLEKIRRLERNIGLIHPYQNMQN